MAELKLIADSGGGTIALKAPATTTSNAAVTLKLPVADGGANQLLKTDGSGNLGWATDSATDSSKMPLAGGTFTGNTLYNDSVKAKFGTSSDLQLYHDGTNSYITNSTGALDLLADSFRFANAANGEYLAKFTANGAVELRYDDSTKLETTSSGISVTGDIATSGHVDLTDNKKLLLGTDDDIEFYSSGSHGYLINDTGVMYVRTDGFYINSGDNSEALAAFNFNGYVGLYYDHSKKLETYASGVLVTGNLKSTGNTYIGNLVDSPGDSSSGHLYFGASNDLTIYHDGTDATIKNITGDLKIEALGGTSDDVLISANDDFVVKVAATETAITASANGGVELYYNDSRTCYTINNGLTFDDNKILKFGSGGDVQVFYDGTNYYTYAASQGHIKTQFHSANGSWEVETTAGEHRIECPQSSTAPSVRLFYNGSPKLDTQNTGVYVTGSVSESSDIALKENIQPLSNSLANLKQLNGYSYKFKDTEKVTGAKTLGLTAQEVEKVYPDLVQGEEGSKSLQYSGLIAPLLEAIKELSTEVETLKTQVAALGG